MMGKGTTSRFIGLILLSAGIFQLIAAVITAFIWLTIVEWRNLIPQIIIIAFSINVPVTFFLAPPLRKERIMSIAHSQRWASFAIPGGDG
jgi:hypothetical protein